MNIIHLITTLERGGAETQLLELASQQVKLGNQVTVIYLKGSGDLVSQFEELGVVILRDFANLTPVLQLRKLRSFIRENVSLKVVHCHLPRAELLGFFTVTRATKLVLSRHNTESFWPARPGAISRVFSSLIIHRASKVVCISNAVKQFVIDNGEALKSDIHKIEVIHYGFRSFVKSETFVPRTQWNAPAKKIITISRLTPQKDLPTMIRGFSIYSKEYTDAKLTIVGKGNQKEQLCDLIRDLDLTKNVEMVDEIENAPEFLVNFDVFLLTSIYEGFGLVLLEAIQARLPVIASNSPAAVEVLGKEHPGLFPIGDAESLARILRGLQNRDVLLRFIEFSDKRLIEFDPRLMVKSIQDLYETL